MKICPLSKTPMTKCCIPFCSLLIMLLLSAGGLFAQTYHTSEASYGLRLGETQPLYESYPYPVTNAEKIKALKKNKPNLVPNFVGRRQLIHHNPNALPQGADPLWQAGSTRMTNDILPTVNFEGINEAQASGTPPDVNGDAGRDFYVEIVNSTHFRVYNKMGQAVSAIISGNTIWSQVGQSSLGDPIILYDQVADRWILTEFASINARRVLIAISKTADPRGSWTAYAFQTPRFPDFPKYGIWKNELILTDNEDGSSFPIYAFNRADLLAEKDTVKMQRLTVPKIGGISFEVAQPVDWDGLNPPPDGSPGMVIKLNDDDWGTTLQDEVQIHKVNIDWNNSAASNIEILKIATSAFDTDGCQLESTGGFSCIPQPNGQGIDGAEWIVSNKVQYRNFGDHEAFVMAFMADVNGQDVAGIRWMEFRRSPTEDWHLYQEGTVGSDDGLHRFMCSIGIDGQGNIGLAYSVSGYDKHPSLRYTGRYASDPLGTMTFTEYEFATGTGSNGFDRFGDYASMSVDPADDATFWFAGEYLKSGGSWATRVVAFSAARDTFDVLPVSLESPLNSAELGLAELVSFTALNRGLKTVYAFPVSYQFDQGAWITEPALIDSLAVDSFYHHTFATPVAFTSAGTYTLKVATGLDVDGNKQNDTLTFLITKYAHLDVALEFIADGTPSTVCADITQATVLIRNVGVDTVFSVTFQLKIDDIIVNEITWNGSLAQGEEATFEFPAGPFHQGSNNFSMTAILVNNLADELTGNNTIMYTIEAKPAGESITLLFTTDNFPAESSWNLFDANQNIIASGTALTQAQHTYEEHFCLDQEACYSFTVYDVFGDGMSAQGVTGDYEILNQAGDVIAELAKPNFGAQSTSAFCLTGECMFSLTSAEQPESSAGEHDGVVIGDVSNALGTVMYSIFPAQWDPKLGIHVT